MASRSPQRISLSPERRASLLDALQRHFDSEFDEPLSAFRAEGLIDFFVRHLGPPVYNQGIRDEFFLPQNVDCVVYNDGTFSLIPFDQRPSRIWEGRKRPSGAAGDAAGRQVGAPPSAAPGARAPAPALAP